MTKRDNAVFAKAFEEMEAKGYFNEIQAKIKAERQAKSVAETIKPVVPKTGKKPRQKAPASVSSWNVADKAPLAASKK